MAAGGISDVIASADDPVVVITISIGAVLIATLLGIWLKSRKNGEKKGGPDGPE
jgi:hypothetical protein